MAKSGKSPWVTLSNAQIMPCIGLGTYLVGALREYIYLTFKYVIK